VTAELLDEVEVEVLLCGVETVLLDDDEVELLLCGVDIELLEEEVELLIEEDDEDVEAELLADDLDEPEALLVCAYVLAGIAIIETAAIDAMARRIMFFITIRF